MRPDSSIAPEQILLAILIYGRLIFMLLATLALASRWQRTGLALLGLFFTTSFIMVLSETTPVLLLLAYVLGLIIILGFFIHEYFIRENT